MVVRLSIALALAVAACGTAAPPAGVVAIDSTAEPLRTQFDAAAGTVRAILLASPT